MWFKSIRYELEDLLGEGGQGRVYRARRRDRATGLEQVVAVKILHSRTAVDLWRREFESLARVRSVHAARMLAFERIGGRPALVLEYVDGISLFQLARAAVLGHDDIRELVAQIEAGLLDLHAQGIFHGDLSLHNVLVDREGRIRLLDFGLANTAGEGARMTPEFASPERLAGAPADLASDLFSLGRLEQYLSGQPAGFDPASPYLRMEPQTREGRGEISDPARRERIALKVREVLERRQRAREASTLTQATPARPRRSRVVAAAVIALSVTFFGPGGRSKDLAEISPLHVRTERWHYLVLDGQPLGYAPLSLPLTVGRAYRLEWISAKGRGTKRILLESAQGLTLRDSDFSH